MPAEKRFGILGRVAQELRVARGDLMGAALAEGGKTFLESDPEVSEAVDFLEFYRSAARWWQEMPALKTRGTGVVVVVSPWNFPIAIPCGGMAAALAAGNTVILKPASDTVLTAWELCQCFWRAGVSKNALQFVTCSGSGEGRKLVNQPKVNAVILTGGTETARGLLRENPRLNLFAETGGKNATMVTALADRDQAVKHILHSAFSHAGQKCSATSLLLLEAEVYNDPSFRRTLCEAVQSIPVGSAWKLETKMGPLIRPPAGDLENALKVLEPGEEWAVMPQNAGGNPRLWSPGVKYGVQAGSCTHLTEFFGPLLAVMRFDKLSEGVALVNQTGYGLTSGLESLDEREWDYWKENVRAGNLYINRVTTGAVVLRQPFGGSGKSCFGPGLKAGGPNYVAQFMEFEDAVAAKPVRAPQSAALARLCEALRKRAGELGSGGAAQADRIAAAGACGRFSIRFVCARLRGACGRQPGDGKRAEGFRAARAETAGGNHRILGGGHRVCRRDGPGIGGGRASRPDRPGALRGAGAGVAGCVESSRGKRHLCGGPPCADGKPGRVALVSAGAEREPGLPSLRQPGHAGGGKTRGGLV